MKTLILAAVILAVCFTSNVYARGVSSTHSGAHSTRLHTTTAKTRAASSGAHIASLVSHASHTTSAHITHTARGGNHGHKSH